MEQTKKYVADLYLRLSKEDGDKEESDSISNQRDLLLDWLKGHPEIELHKIRIDDGYSGVDFRRPAFSEMIQDMSAGIVNCCICKDFSRFGRNYIESGKYIQQLFPRTGIRFVAVTDCYDSSKIQGYTDNIIVPFKNMMNDAYSADISMKVRSHLEIKRNKGAFVGAFAVYGYRKDETDHNRLVIDSFAADVVRDIFKWKLEGLSAQAIAERLNANGILSPMEYKRYCGLRYSTSFKVNATAKWQAKAIFRILTNEVYLGVVEQGKRVTPNYKVRKRVEVPKDQWARAEGVHEPIIDDRNLFDTVQELLKQDTRAASGSMAVNPLSGVVVCADCGGAMVRKVNTNKSGKKYGYYVCSKHRADKEVCGSHLISIDECENAVLYALKNHIAVLLDMDRVLACAEHLPYLQDNIRKLTARLEAKRDEIAKYCELRLSLHESYHDGVLSKEDFISFKSSYDVKIADAESAAQSLKEEIEKLAAGEASEHGWVERFRAYAGADTLERKIIAELVQEVSIIDKEHIEVKFRYMDEYEKLEAAVKGVA
jgi:DNA invertase Pin-like site-specific DNA recombinase